MNGQHIRRGSDIDDRGEILHRVVRKLGIQSGIGSVRRVIRHEKCVAIRGCTRGELGTERAARPGPRVDDHRLPETLAKLIAQYAADDIRRAARRLCDENAYGPYWIILRRG